MKRYIALLSATLLLLMLCSGCSPNKGTTSSVASGPIASAASDVAQGVSSIASAAEEGVESVGSEVMDEVSGDTASPAASK